MKDGKNRKKLFHKQEKQNDNLPKMDIGEEIPVTEINRLCKKHNRHNHIHMIHCWLQ